MSQAPSRDPVAVQRARPVRPVAARTPDAAPPSLLASDLSVSVPTPPPGRRPPSFAPTSSEVAVVRSLSTEGSWFLSALSSGPPPVQGSLMRLLLPGAPACCGEHPGRVPGGRVSVRECPREETCGRQRDPWSSGSFRCKGRKLAARERGVALRAAAPPGPPRPPRLGLQRSRSVTTWGSSGRGPRRSRMLLLLIRRLHLRKTF